MSDERDDLTFHVGTREIYDEVVGMRSDIRTLVDDHKDTEKQIGDHEARIRALERWRYATPTAAVAALVSGAVGLAQHAGLL